MDGEASTGFRYLFEVMKKAKPPPKGTGGWGPRIAPRIQCDHGDWLVVMSFQTEQEAEAFARHEINGEK